MNILYISRTMGQGGAEKIVYQLAVGLQEQQNNIYVASSGGYYVNRLKKYKIPHYQIQDPESKRPATVFENLIILYRIIKRCKIDIVHTHHRAAALYASLLKFVCPQIKLVYTAHNVFFNRKILTCMALGNTYIAAVGLGVKKNLTDFFSIRQEKIQ